MREVERCFYLINYSSCENFEFCKVYNTRQISRNGRKVVDWCMMLNFYVRVIISHSRNTVMNTWNGWRTLSLKPWQHIKNQLMKTVDMWDSHPLSKQNIWYPFGFIFTLSLKSWTVITVSYHLDLKFFRQYSNIELRTSPFYFVQCLFLASIQVEFLFFILSHCYCLIKWSLSVPLPFQLIFVFFVQSNGIFCCGSYFILNICPCKPGCLPNFSFFLSVYFFQTPQHLLRHLPRHLNI